MSRPVNLFGLCALLPMALNGPMLLAAGTLTMPICTGDGQVRMVQVPVRGGGGGDPTREPGGCCLKGCHAGSRKRVLEPVPDDAE